MRCRGFGVSVTACGVLLTLSVAAFVSYQAGRATAGLRITAVRGGAHWTYTTAFSTTENPISEGGNWENGQLTAYDWTNVRTVKGLALGTESGRKKYDDSNCRTGRNVGR
jgi:hypothetical protein